MTSVDALREWAIADEEYRYLKGKMEEYSGYIASVRGLNGMQYNGLPKSSNPSNPTAIKAERVLMAEREYLALKKEMVQRTKVIAKAQKVVESTLLDFGPTYRKIAELRYKKRNKWQGIATALGYEVRTIMRKHEELLEEIEKKL